MINNKQIITIKEACRMLNLNDKSELYQYIYNNYKPQDFMQSVFNEICNNDRLAHFNKKFNNYYLYKVTITIKISNGNNEKYFLLEAQDIEEIITKYYKLNIYAMKNMWKEFLNSKKSYNQCTITTETQEKLYQIIQNEYEKIIGTNKKTTIYIKDIVNKLYENNKEKYGKIPQLKTEIKKKGFKIQREKYGNAYIIIKDKNNKKQGGTNGR